MKLAEVIGTTLRKKGAEHHGPCPFCGEGEDRFVVWNDGGRDETGRFWCRRCEESGDAIDYLRRIRGMTYHEALSELGIPDDKYVANSVRTVEKKSDTASQSANGHCESYGYTDEGGTLLHEVVRNSKKKFRQRRLAANGKWVYNMKGVRRVLYRLPQIMEAIDQRRAIFIVEGEKDVHSLESLNLVATTSAQGSGSWRDEYADQLEDALEVIVIPDRDTPGLKYASAVVESLGQRRIPFRVLHLPVPHGQDVSDWLAGREVSPIQARHELIEMAVSAGRDVYEQEKPYPMPYTMEELLTREFKPRESVVPGIVPFGVTLFVGKPKTGKTFFALSIAHAVACGGLALGSIQVKRGRVLYLVLEDSQRGLQNRMRHLSTIGGDTGGRLMFVNEWKKMDDEGLAHLDQFLKDYPDTSLVIIDTLKRVRPEADRRKGIYDQDYEALFPLTALAEIHDTSFLVMHHANKQHDLDDPADLASGSTGLTGAAENIMVMRRTSAHEGVDLWMRGRDAEEVEMALVFDPSTLSWRYKGDAREFGISEQRKRILDVIRNAKDELTSKEIAEIADLDYSSTRNMVSKMVQAGMISKAGYGKYKVNVAYEWGSIGRDEPLLPKTHDSDDSGDTLEATTATDEGKDDGRPLWFATTVTTVPDGGSDKPMTPLKIRHKLNDIERWVQSHREVFAPPDLLLCLELLETACTETHLLALQGWLSETIDES